MNTHTIPVSTTSLPKSGYYLLYSTDESKLLALELSGEEPILVMCPKCGKPFLLEFVEFCSIMGGEEHDLYSTRVHCTACSAKDHAERQEANHDCRS